MFSIIRGGCNSMHPNTFYLSRPNGLNHYVLLIIKRQTWSRFGDKEFTIKPTSAILIDCHTPYQYHSVSGDFVNDWIHFDSSDKEYFQGLDLPLNEPIFLKNPTALSFYIGQILWESNYSPAEFRQTNIDMLMKLLINSIIIAKQDKDVASKYSPYYSKFQRLRMNIQSTPNKDYSPEEISASMGISLSYFQHLYTNFFSIPFKADLINMRIEYVKSLLLNSDLNMEEIALICGYANEIHFYRQFHKKTGMTPREFRISGGSSI